MGKQRKKRRVPMGQPLPDATEETAVPTPEEIERAKVNYRKFAKQGWQGLLDAEIMQGDEFS